MWELTGRLGLHVNHLTGRGYVRAEDKAVGEDAYGINGHKQFIAVAAGEQGDYRSTMRTSTLMGMSAHMDDRKAKGTCHEANTATGRNGGVSCHKADTATIGRGK